MKIKIGLWLCKKDKHKTPKMVGWDGTAFNGICPRCGIYVLKDHLDKWRKPQRTYGKNLR